MSPARVRSRAVPLSAATLSFTTLLSVLMALWAGKSLAAQDSGLTGREQRGRQIYLHGTSRSGKEITAILGSGETELPAATMACASCHGLAGLGTTEGGISPSNLTWDSLTRPYDVTAPTGRKHGPYNERTLKRAFTMGLDPAGNKLDAAMPRFRISIADADDLLAYIKKLGHTLDPGLTDTSIRLATVTPNDGPLAATGLAVSAALQAYFDDLNDRGGVYGRRIEFRPSLAVTRAGLESFLRDQNIFAVISPLIAGSEKELLPLFEEQGVPLVGPFTYLPQSGFPINRHIFYLYSGLDDQARALCQFAANNLKAGAVGLVVPGQGLAAGLPAAIRERCNSLNLKIVAEIPAGGDAYDAARLTNQLSDAGAATVLFLGSAGEAVELARAAARIGWRPNLLLIGSLEGQELFNMPMAFGGRAFVAYPTLPSDWSPDRLRAFAAMAEKHGLPARHMSSQISAISAAEILVEGLRRSGKDLSRANLVDQLEGLYGYKTGLTPAVTFGPNRRIGALGAYVVLLDTVSKRFVPAAAWVPLD